MVNLQAVALGVQVAQNTAEKLESVLEFVAHEKLMGGQECQLDDYVVSLTQKLRGALARTMDRIEHLESAQKEAFKANPPEELPF